MMREWGENGNMREWVDAERLGRIQKLFQMIKN